MTAGMVGIKYSPTAVVHQGNVENIRALLRGCRRRITKRSEPPFYITFSLPRAAKLVPIACGAAFAGGKCFESIQFGFRLLQNGEARCEVAPIKCHESLKLRCFDKLIPAFLMFSKSAVAKAKIVVCRCAGTSLDRLLINQGCAGVVLRCSERVSEIEKKTPITWASFQRGSVTLGRNRILLSTVVLITAAPQTLKLGLNVTHGDADVRRAPGTLDGDFLRSAPLPYFSA